MAQFIKFPSDLALVHWREYDRIVLDSAKHRFALVIYVSPGLVGEPNNELLIRVEDANDAETQREIKARLGGAAGDPGWQV